MDIRCDGVDVVVVLEGDVLALEEAEIADDLPALRHGNIELSRVHRVEEQASIRADDLEIGTSTRRIFEVQLEGPADCSVQEAESVLAGLDIEVRPRLSIYVDNIAEEISGLQRVPSGLYRLADKLRGTS